MGLENNQSEGDWGITVHLTYGMEAIFPVEIGMPTIRTEIVKKENVEAIAKDLDTTDKLWEVTAVRIASYQQRLENLHNRRVKPRTFLARELVLRRVFENTANLVDRKFQPNWEGPYMVVQVGTTRSYCDAPNLAPDGVSSGGATLRDCDSLTFSFSELTPAFICTISVITKNLSFYIYIIHTTIVAFIIFYRHILESLYLYYYNFTITKLYI